MNQRNNQLKYRGNGVANFADEIIFGDNSITSKNQIDYSDINLFASNNKHKNSPELASPNYLLSFSILSFSLIALTLVFSKIISTTFVSFNSLTTSFFVGGYFILFIATIFIISKRKMLTLEIKNGELHLKSFPALNQKIPTSQILRCELNTMHNGKYNPQNKIHFALNENGNRYKQPLTSGIILQLLNGQHIVIASHKS